ncbi:AMP-binding protein [Pseudomonas paraversuta]|uniref:AMP-binding protein n=1 Tax=Pseudomonas TaxID=286 RepID=UPI001367E17D|nr:MULTISPECIES: AMP-binding protein [Pseudomonas]NBG92602.1 AMP-dependent synthetase [Pseudomonas sp. 9.1(2019)]
MTTPHAAVRHPQWETAPRFNIARACCDRWAAEPGRIAIIQKNADGSVQQHSFLTLQQQANRLANSLREQGVQPGDRVGIMLPQGLEAGTAHIALYKLGAIAVPLFKLFGSDAIEHRASNCSMGVLITDNSGLQKIEKVWARLPDLKLCYVIDPVTQRAGVLDYHARLKDQSDQFETLDTGAEDPALIIYTSGTTGHPKGALHAHRVLLGHLPGVRSSHDDFPQPGDRMWTPADWAWIGGLLDVLLPAWYHGVPVVAYRAEKFVAEEVFELIEELQIKNVFFPPTALKLLRPVENPQQRWQLALRSVASGGESLGDELLAWGDQALGVRINEFYGQTECNLVVSSCASLGVCRPHAIGRAVEGFNVAIIDDYGVVVPTGDSGHIAVATPNGSQMLRYWQNTAATEEKYLNGWLVTGDKGSMDEDGYIFFLGRNDDVITSAGYRIGPTPIEDCLIKHPAVKMAAAIGKKDPIRTEVVKAFVVLNAGYAASAETIGQLQAHVRAQLAAHEYPREIEFLDELPMTTTGKIIRKALREREEHRTAMELDV